MASDRIWFCGKSQEYWEIYTRNGRPYNLMCDLLCVLASASTLVALRYRHFASFYPIVPLRILDILSSTAAYPVAIAVSLQWWSAFLLSLSRLVFLWKNTSMDTNVILIMVKIKHIWHSCTMDMIFVQVDEHIKFIKWK